MAGNSIDVHVHHHLDDAVLSELRRIILRFQERVMTTQAELAQQLLAVRDQITKVGAEVNGKIAELEAAVQAAGQVSPEVEAAFASLRAALQPIDDLVPDAPKP